MTSNDVRSILNIPSSSSIFKSSVPSSGSIQPSNRKAIASAKKPDGISRELYALIGNHAPSLAQAQASVASLKYRERPTTANRTRKWQWRPLPHSPSTASKQSRLCHWVRESDGSRDTPDAHFDSFNLTGPSVFEYSLFEYEQFLLDPDWSVHETTYLFDLLKEYDLRFVIVSDRYSYRGIKGDAAPKSRSIEEIKHRYYSICQNLVKTRTATDPNLQQQLMQTYTFDRVRETKRKHYASELFHLTAAEIAEEEALFVEIKRMEQTERRYATDRDDLMRTVLGLDSGLVNLDQARGEGVVGMDKNKKRKRAEDGDPSPPTPIAPMTVSKRGRESAAFDIVHCIHRVSSGTLNDAATSGRHTNHLPVYLRSSRLAVPKSSAAVRVTEMLDELDINMKQLVMPTVENSGMLERLLHAAGALTDMKRQVDRVDHEIRTLTIQKEGFIPAARKSRSDSIASTDTTATSRKR